MYKCDKCGRLNSESAIDIGVDLEDIGARCDCGGRWMRVDSELCHICGNTLEINPCVDREDMENYNCPNYPYCPTLGTRRKLSRKPSSTANLML